MKKILWLFVITSQLFGFDYHLRGVQVTQNVKCFFGDSGEPNPKNGGNMVNTCVINAGDKTVIVDSGPTAVYAQSVVATLKKHPPIQAVINTHFHDDHLGGNSFYQERKIPIIGHANIVAHYEKEPERFDRMKNFVTQDAYHGTSVALPTVMMEKAHTIATQKGDIIIYHLVPKSHTDTDIIVYFPAEKIVFAGDLVFNDRIFPTRDASLKGWLEALELLQKLDYTVLIPGHGRDISRKGDKMTKEYLSTLRTQVAQAIDNGAEMTDITTKVDLGVFKSYPLYHELNGKNILRAYELFERGEE